MSDCSISFGGCIAQQSNLISSGTCCRLSGVERCYQMEEGGRDGGREGGREGGKGEGGRKGGGGEEGRMEGGREGEGGKGAIRCQTVQTFF